MKHAKKLLCLALALVMSLSLVACSSSSGDGKADCSDATKRAALQDFDRVLSLNLFRTDYAEQAPAEEDPEAERIKALIEKRALAKKNRDFATADAIRSELAAQGITLIDTKEGTTYKRG